jgi:hypothetical protein
MTTYIAITDPETDPDAPLTSELAKKWRDNPISMFEGDATAVAAGVTLRDAALDTGAATDAGTTWVALRTAGVAAGAVGSYAFLGHSPTPLTAAEGSTHAASALRFANASLPTAVAPSGTWRQMGRTSSSAGEQSITLFLRIS